MPLWLLIALNDLRTAAIGGVVVWAFGWYQKRSLDTSKINARIPEVDHDAAEAGGRAASNWKALYDSEVASRAQLSSDMARMGSRLRKLEMREAQTEQENMRKQHQIDKLEDIVALMIPALPKIDASLKDAVERRLTELAALREEQRISSRQRETLMRR